MLEWKLSVRLEEMLDDAQLDEAELDRSEGVSSRVAASTVLCSEERLLKEARRVRCLDEVLSSNVRRRAQGRVIFRAWLSTKSYTQCCGGSEELW
jgi:hypothetical protein